MSDMGALRVCHALSIGWDTGRDPWYIRLIRRRCVRKGERPPGKETAMRGHAAPGSREIGPGLTAVQILGILLFPDVRGLLLGDGVRASHPPAPCPCGATGRD